MIRYVLQMIYSVNMIYTSTDVQRLIAQIPRGKSNAIHAADLAILLGYSPHPNQEELRGLIRYAINQGELIGSNRTGYWIIDTREEVEAVLNSLERRAQGVCDRRNNLLISWNTNNPQERSNLQNMDVKL